VKLSPEVVSTEVKDNQIILILDQPIQAGKIETFEVAGADGKFANATATADGNRITILSPLPSHLSPLSIRYAWKDNPLQANVRSLSGLPMSSFEITIK
jgi:sialate O-acetylesterase